MIIISYQWFDEVENMKIFTIFDSFDWITEIQKSLWIFHIYPKFPEKNIEKQNSDCFYHEIFYAAFDDMCSRWTNLIFIQ